MDFFKGIEVCDSDFCGREANDGAILLVERVNVKDSLAGDDGAFEPEVCEASVPWAWKVSGRTCKACV